MAQREIGAVCSNDHFTFAFHLFDPVDFASIERQANRRALPTQCSICDAPLVSLPLTVEGEEVERPQRGGSTLSRSSGGSKPKVGPLTPAKWKKAVWERQALEQGRGGQAPLCAVTREELNFIHDDAHHPLEKRLLKARGEHHRMYDPRNGMFVKARVHQGHTSMLAKIPAEYVPPCAFTFAREVGPWAIARIESDHPKKEK